VPWQAVQAGVYDCRWGTDTVRVVVAGELPRAAHNAPLHLFSASPELVGFGGTTYRRRSEGTSALLIQLFEGFEAEGFSMPYTMEDFNRQFAREHFRRLTPEQQQEALRTLSPEGRQELLQSLPTEERLAGLSPEQIREYLERLSAKRPAPERKPRRKK
jgi:hypothetical protein